MFVSQIRSESSLAQSFKTQKAKAVCSLAQSAKHLSVFVSCSDGKYQQIPAVKHILECPCKCCEADIEY